MKELLLGIAIAYVIMIIAAGMYFYRRVRSVSDFLVAGRTLPLPIVLGTMWATYIGGATMIGWTGAFYSLGLDWWFLGLGAIAGIILISTVFAKRVRKLGVATLPELIELRYDRTTRFVLAFMMSIAYIAIYAVQIIALGTVLHVFLGIPRELTYTMAMIAFIAIAIPGGLKGVAIVDAIQATFMALAIVLGGSISIAMAGGLKAWEMLPEQHKMFLGYFTPITALGSFIAVLGIAAVEQAIFIQRFAAARDIRIAHKAGLLMALGAFFGYFMGPYLMGTAAYVILGPGIRPGEVFPKLTLALPPWVGTLLFVAVFATIVTTANSILISATANVVWDVIGTLKPTIREETMFKLLRIATALIGILGLPWALLFPGIVEALVFAYIIYAAVAFIPL